MRAVLTRVKSASVSVDGNVIGQIGPGFLILLGITHDDTEAQAVKLADKLTGLRIFEDEDGKMNRGLETVNGGILVISQFTLYGNCRKGRRPDFLAAARPEVAIPLYEKFVSLCREKGILFHTDAVQAAGHLPIDVQAQHIDMLSLSGHKFHGPKGVGALYVRQGVPITSLIEGGAQERGKRAGTENVPGIAGMAAALEDACAHMEENRVKVTALRDKLIDGLDGLDYIERVATQQKNWIGRSHGAEVNFGTTAGDTLTVYTTRCDTLFGATYMVISPEHALLKAWLEKGIIKNAEAVKAYQAEAARKSDFERSELNKEKTGVQLDGVMGINPVNETEIPIFISDYVLSTYGTGAIMAVPAHDTRDWEFAKKFGLPIIEVVKGNTPSNLDEAAFTDVATGTLVNSGFLNGLSVVDAKKKMITWLEENGKGRDKVNYKLRDWVFSRQRYWGEPIPMVHCDKCGWQPLPESSLPLTLPDITDFEPGPDGESPLARHKDWVKTTCPCCGGPATRETDTMPQWAGSSWYFLRYMDPHCKDALASKEALEYWSPVDWYNGGMEHTTLHLLYSRFWHKFLYDIGVVPTAEPYQKRTAHGMILGLNPHSFVNLPAEEQEKLLKEYGSQKAAEKALEEKYGEMARHPIVKMSKSLGNVINPDEVVDQYGADTMRLYEMFMGDFEQAAPWQTSAIAGCNRFLDRVWALSDKLVEGEGYRPAMETLMHQTIKKVSADIESLKMNTAIAQLMTLVNALYDNGGATKAEFETLVQLLNPFAPHMTEELWEKLGHSHDEQLAYYPWPAYEEAKCVEAAVEIAVQVNGKVKARLKVPADITAEDAIATAKADPAVAAALEGKQLVKEIYVKGRLVNLAAKG